MHSSLWHKSPKNKKKLWRLYLEINIQSVDDPTTQYILNGNKRNSYLLGSNQSQIFKSSRVQRIERLYKQIKSEDKDHQQSK